MIRGPIDTPPLPIETMINILESMERDVQTNEDYGLLIQILRTDIYRVQEWQPILWTKMIQYQTHVGNDRIIDAVYFLKQCRDRFKDQYHLTVQDFLPEVIRNYNQLSWYKRINLLFSIAYNFGPHPDIYRLLMTTRVSEYPEISNILYNYGTDILKEYDQDLAMQLIRLGREEDGTNDDDPTDYTRYMQFWTEKNDQGFDRYNADELFKFNQDHPDNIDFRLLFFKIDQLCAQQNQIIEKCSGNNRESCKYVLQLMLDECGVKLDPIEYKIKVFHEDQPRSKIFQPKIL